MSRGISVRLALLAAAVAVATSWIAVSLTSSAGAVAPNPNPWLQKRFLVMAHQGGEDEAPSNTMFALKSAIQDRGADSLELDVNLAKDEAGVPNKDELMVIHDDTWSRIACTAALCPGPDASSEQVRPANEVNDKTVSELQALDAGYWFRPGSYSHNYSVPASDYLYRGIRTGSKTPPAGYSDTDFEIPTLRQVLDTFPSIPINVEIKMIKTTTGTAGGCTMSGGTQYCDDPVASIPVADAVADLLNEPQYASRNDLIVVSFSDDLIDRFHQMDGPPYVALAPGVQDTTNFALSGTPPDPDIAAFQVPPDQSGIQVPELLLGARNAHCLGYAVHIWTNGDQDETPAAYQRFYASGADGVMTSKPSALSAWLAANNVPRPDPRDPCPTPSQSPGSTQGAPASAKPPAPQHKKKKCHKAKKKKKRAASAKKKHGCKKHKKHKRH